MTQNPRLDVFLALNAGTDKVPWQERVKLINEVFPTTVKMDWMKAFNDIDLFGRILRDILKVDQTSPGRSGPRPVLDRKKATERLRQFMGADYSDAIFPQAFRELAAGKSVRGISAKTGVEKTMVQNLLTGKRQPDVALMEQIARAFKKEPAYFYEYRIAYVLAALGDRMSGSPEMTVDLYKKLKGS